jgi:hypothetical protein
MSSSLQARWLQAGVLQRLLPEAQASQTTQKILIVQLVLNGSGLIDEPCLIFFPDAFGSSDLLAPQYCTGGHK